MGRFRIYVQGGVLLWALGIVGAMTARADIWGEIVQSVGESSGTFTYGCASAHATTDNCGAWQTQSACAKAGCARVVVVNERPYVESSSCRWGESKVCTCDGSQLRPG